MTFEPRDPFSEVVDERRRWMPDWYSWLIELVKLVNGTHQGDFTLSAGGILRLEATEDVDIVADDDIDLNAVDNIRFNAASFLFGNEAGALATTAVEGFVHVPTCAGTPTGVPILTTGLAPIVIDSTNNKLYFYSGGAWRDAGP